MTPDETTPPPRRWNLLSIISVVSAFGASAVAIVTGLIALSQIRRSAERGRGLAVAGVVLGCLGFALSVVLVSAIAVAHPWSTVRASTGGAAGAAPAGGMTPPVAESMDWAAGLDLASSDRPVFVDTLSTSSAWVVGTPQPDSTVASGTWSYSSADKQCAVTFAEGPLPGDVGVTENDDRRRTDSYLQSLAATSADFVYQTALDDYLTFGDNASAFVSMRTLSGTDPQGNIYITAARAFTKTGTGVSFDLRCANGVDIDEYYYTVVAGVNVAVR